MGTPVDESPPDYGDDCGYCDAGKTPSLLSVKFSGVQTCASCNYGGGGGEDLWRVFGDHGAELNARTFPLEQSGGTPCLWSGLFDWIGTFQNWGGTWPELECDTLLGQTPIEKLLIEVQKTATKIIALVKWYTHYPDGTNTYLFFFDDVYPEGLSDCMNVTLSPNVVVCDDYNDWGAGGGKMIITEITPD